jgi:hypothetical protein
MSGCSRPSGLGARMCRSQPPRVTHSNVGAPLGSRPLEHRSDGQRKQRAGRQSVAPPGATRRPYRDSCSIASARLSLPRLIGQGARHCRMPSSNSLHPLAKAAASAPFRASKRFALPSLARAYANAGCHDAGPAEPDWLRPPRYLRGCHGASLRPPETKLASRCLTGKQMCFSANTGRRQGTWDAHEAT